jgi:tetraacyldisaccharide 4'-kinase
VKKMRKLLLPFSFLYWIGITVRNWFFDIGLFRSKKVSVPVISVGNVSTGGVGKTPFVELLIEKLSHRGPLSVVSRGYGRKSHGTVVVSDGHGIISSVENSGDEPMQLAHRYRELIVVVDEQRVRGAQKAIELGARIIILDDGFQHRYLNRDLDIVVVSAGEILNGDVLLPAGNRREPFSSLKRADVIAVTRCADANEYEHVCAVGRERHIFPAHSATVGLTTKLKGFTDTSNNESVNAELLRNKNLIAFSGIGNPKSFKDLLLTAKINVVTSIDFPDHHWYQESDVKKIVDEKKRAHADFILTTEKDATRLKGRFEGFLETESVLAVEIQQEIHSGEQRVEELIKRIT